MNFKERYGPPLDRLLSYGDALEMRKKSSEWPEYVTELGLGPEHIEGLTQMALDEELDQADSDSLLVWAPLHAWRALGQLKAISAIPGLLTLLESDSEWAWEELPEVCAMVGPETIPMVAEFLADKTHSEAARNSSTACLEKIAEIHPKSRTECIKVFTRQLEKMENLLNLNGFLIAALLELKAVSAAPVIEIAFQVGRVDPMVAGDWEDVQVALGLIPERKSPPIKNNLPEMDRLIELLERAADSGIPTVKQAPTQPVSGRGQKSKKKKKR